jgi:hypothetical protein
MYCFLCMVIIEAVYLSYRKGEIFIILLVGRLRGITGELG